MNPERRMLSNTLTTTALLLAMVAVAGGVTDLWCSDWKGDPVSEGSEFVPHRDDSCYRCTCEGGYPVACKNVLCSAPDCGSRKAEAVEGECCKFTCVDRGDLPEQREDGVNKTIAVPPEFTDTVEAVDTANLGLKLVASTVTSFLILALLLFMVHRLRQRRLLIMMRRMHAAREEDGVAYMTQFDQVDMMGIEFPPYEEPPPPYTPPKPPDYPNGEAPPPYTPEHNNNEEGRLPVRPGGGFMRGAHGGRTLQGETHPVPNGTHTIPCPGTSSQGTSTTQHALGPRSDVLSCCDDVVTPDSETDTNYGLSVSYVNQTSPGDSHVIIRLQSRHPQSVSTGTSTANDDSGSQSNKESANSDTLVKKSNPQMQFIKRSDSVEIKRGSNSPRNSYVGACERGCDSPTPRKQPLNGASESATPTSTPHNVDSPTFERSPLLKPEQSTPPGGVDVSITWTRGSKPFRIPSNASSGATSSSPDTRSNGAYGANRRSPPQSLPVVPITERPCDGTSYGEKNTENGNTAAPNHHHHRRLPEVSPPNSRPVLHSPLSPTGGVQVMPRSGSIASQVSQFSVCSETGEKKRPKFSVVPIAIGNDSPYPVSPLSCSNMDAIPGPSGQSSVDSGVPSASEGGSQTSSSSSSAVSSPLMESDTLMPSATSPSATSDSASQLDSRGSTLDRPKLKGSKPVTGNCVVVNGDVDDLSAINNNYVSNDDSPQKGDVPSRVRADRNQAERSNSYKSDRSAADSRSGVNAPSEKSTVRKVKQRKRRPKENGSSCEVNPVRISYVDGTADVDSPAVVNGTSDSDRRRRPSRGRESTSPKFKQYGFIDNPEALSNRDPASPPKNGRKSVHRQNSKEKTPKEHRHSSRHSSTDKDKSRESSRDRRRRSGSRDRNVHKLDNEVISHRDRNVDSENRERIIDNAAFINGGDAGGSRNNKHGERVGKHQRDMTSSSQERRRKRRSTGDKTFPDSHTQGQGHKHSQTAPALNGYHDNADIVVVDNDDDVFINNHSNETVDNIHHYQTKRNKSRTNRHSVPTLDNRTVRHLDR